MCRDAEFVILLSFLEVVFADAQISHESPGFACQTEDFFALPLAVKKTKKKNAFESCKFSANYPGVSCFTVDLHHILLLSLSPHFPPSPTNSIHIMEILDGDVQLCCM